MERSILKNLFNSVELFKSDELKDNTEPSLDLFKEGAETIPSGSRVQADSKKEGSIFICSDCGETGIKHHALGRCLICYRMKYQKNNKERLCQYNKERYQDNLEYRERAKNRAKQSYKNDPLPARARSKAKYYADPKQDNLSRAERQFGGNYCKVLDRDQRLCQSCKATEHLSVHHKDRDRKNNDLSNLITLCSACHTRLHHKGIKNPKKNAWKNGNRLRYSPISQVTGRTFEEASNV